MFTEAKYHLYATTKINLYESQGKCSILHYRFVWYDTYHMILYYIVSYKHILLNS